MNSIGICICTYGRARLLKELLETCAMLETPEGWQLMVFVVDNDLFKSAERVVNKVTSKYSLPIFYDVEPIRNIAKTRNRVVRNALNQGCLLLAMIDDDELPDRGWITELYQALVQHNCAGVLGPVLPRYESSPPTWVIQTGFLTRTFSAPGTPLHWSSTRTGNVLLRASILSKEKESFDPRFGESGGEDLDFFRHMMDKGHRFVGVNSGRVHELIPEHRMHLSHMARRAYIQGDTSIRLLRKYGAGLTSLAGSTGKSLTAITIYAAILPLFLLFGKIGVAGITPRLFFHIGRLRWLLRSPKRIRRAEFH